jgi:hypothetical protein
MLGAARAPAIKIFSINAMKTYKEMNYIFAHSVNTKEV